MDEKVVNADLTSVEGGDGWTASLDSVEDKDVS